MRRSAFYMGQTWTARHLNRCRSPLMTGFIPVNGTSFTTSSMAANALKGHAGALSLSVPTASSLLSVCSEDLALKFNAATLQMVQSWIEVYGLNSVVTFLLASVTELG